MGNTAHWRCEENRTARSGCKRRIVIECQKEVVAQHPTYSRPKVSNDNPYSESIFRTVKYRPEFPAKPFESIAAAKRWVNTFVVWYNTRHLHSSIGFTTPNDRHQGKAPLVLLKRQRVYEQARKRNPSRWARHTRKWEAPKEVLLNSSTETRQRWAA